VTKQPLWRGNHPDARFTLVAQSLATTESRIPTMAELADYIARMSDAERHALARAVLNSGNAARRKWNDLTALLVGDNGL